MANVSPILSAPVGAGQPNNMADVVLVRSYLNGLGRAGLLPHWRGSIPDVGPWDGDVAAGIKAVEEQYFYGEADPNNKLENDDTLFQFIVHAADARACFAETLSNEVYKLAAVMVPGGADHTKRKIVATTTIVKGKPQVQKQVVSERVRGHIRDYLPDILKALTATKLNDTDMLMMALGTIRAETSNFVPIDEGVSRFNTNPIATKGRFPFDRYEDRADLGNVDAGDGPLYKGRGFVQLTGHSNYTTIGGQIGQDLEKHPDLANDPAVSALILAQFLKNKEAQIRRAVAADDLTTARKLVNGGSHGLAEFKSAFAAGRAYLGIVVLQKAKTAIKRRKHRK
jgi:hypothetical protein